MLYITTVEWCFDACIDNLVGAGLLGAVNALKQGLQEIGSDLIILQGSMETELPQLVNSVQASCIVLEEEVEYR